jgi:hypothetical protein
MSIILVEFGGERKRDAPLILDFSATLAGFLCDLRG